MSQQPGGGGGERGEGCMCGPVLLWNVGIITLQRVPELAKLVYAATREKDGMVRMWLFAKQYLY